MSKLVQLTPDRDYMMISKEIIQSLKDPLSLSIFMLLSSYPEENISTEDLAKHFGIEPHTVFEALPELSSRGLI